MTSKTIELYLAVNDDGNFHISEDSPQDAVAELADNHGFVSVRTLKVSITFDLPEITAINATVPAPSQAPAVVTVS